jgi:RimJ/RimL family protein N-acetyltransferase
LSEELGALWRCRGTTPSPEAWAQGISAGVLAQFLVVRRSDGVPIGVVTCYRADFENQHAYLAAAKFTRDERATHLLEGTILFIDYVLRCWNFRKLYLEVNGFNLPQLQSGIGRLLKEEGRLVAHVFFDGRYWDQHLVSLWRADWESAGFGSAIRRLGGLSDDARG